MHKDRLEQCLWLTSLKQEQKQAHENSIQEYICPNLKNQLIHYKHLFFIIKNHKNTFTRFCSTAELNERPLLSHQSSLKLFV